MAMLSNRLKAWSSSTPWKTPYRLDEALQDELGVRLARVPLNRYPAAQIERFRLTLARHIDLPSGCDLMLGNGSDELIGLVAMACNKDGASVLAPEPGFVMYRLTAMQQRMRFHGVPLAPSFDLDVEAMLEGISTHRPSVVYLAYPNNPTANLWHVEAMRRVIAASPGLVVVDEAYQPFSDRTWLDEIRAHPNANQNVLLLRTFSKFGLAGARLGYMLGPQALVGEIDKLRPPYNVSTLNAECGLFALEHADVFSAQAQSIRNERRRLSGALGRLRHVSVFPSDANMILVRVQNAAGVFAHLLKHKILVKNVASMHPLLADCLRLTVGTPDENNLLIKAMEDWA